MRLLLLFFPLALAATAQTGAPAASLQNLITNSPFGSAAQAGGAPAAATPLEFRGTFVDGGERFFSILDPNTRRAEWVGLNEAGRPFTVKSYSPENESISVDFQGRVFDLKLHSARIVAAPLAPTPQIATAPGQPAPAAAQMARPAQPPSASEAQRLAQVAEEIRRRRALRQQAQGQPAQTPTPPPATPQN